MHIGMIGGIGPAATEFYYRKLVQLCKIAGRRLELTIVHAEAADLIENITENRPDRQAQILAEMAGQLSRAGADTVVLSSIAGHFCVSELEVLSPLPIINAISALAEELANRGIRRVGLLGNRVSMESHLFGGVPGIDFILPPGNCLNAVHDEYIRMATTGTVNEHQRQFLWEQGAALCDEFGAEIVLLAGTDLFLAFDGVDCGFPIIDCALVHIQKIASEGGVSAAASALVADT